MPKSFELFCMNFNLLNKDVTLVELMSKLQAAEMLTKQGLEDFVAEKISTSKRGKKKQKSQQKQEGTAKKAKTS